MSRKLKYLASRRLMHPEMIGHFFIGLANRTLDYRKPGQTRDPWMSALTSKPVEDFLSFVLDRQPS